MKKIIIISVILGLFIAANMALAKNDSDKNSFSAVWSSISELSARMDAVESSCAANPRQEDSAVKRSADASKPKASQEDNQVYKSEDFKMTGLTLY